MGPVRLGCGRLMPSSSPRIRPFLALMQGLLLTVRAGLRGPDALSADGSHQSHFSVPPLGGTPTIERLGARGGLPPAARDGRVARRRACASRRDLPDVRRHPEPGGRPRRAGSCRPRPAASRSTKHT